ncbi:MAG TPA: thioredoxin-dependent thiol peroxidase [Alphaproteobacteria bacterium]|nr:thioredoxin-dependent thiol peroxidase [Alphaproteobacteria bacterium]
MENTKPVELTEGKFAPDFVLDTDGSGTFTLSSFRGNKNVVLYFYPKDDTPGCTIEAKDFADNQKNFDKAGTVIIGVSKDDIKSHNKFKEKYCLPFTLGSDANSTVCEAYGVWVEKNMYGKKYMGVQRDTFLIDKTGKIRKIWRKVKVEGHVNEVLSAAKNL